VSEYVVIIERDEAGGYSAWAPDLPDLPGVIAAASSYDETLALMREAVEFHLEGLREDGQPIPAPTAVGAKKSSRPYKYARQIITYVS
jgi:predicted RNase H-like HicB family nuclease